MTHLCSRKMTQAKNPTWRRARIRCSIIHAEGVRCVADSSRPEAWQALRLYEKSSIPARRTRSRIVWRAPNADEGGYLATLADIDSTTLEQGHGSILTSKPGSYVVHYITGQFSRVPKRRNTVCPRFKRSEGIIVRDLTAVK